MNRVRDILAENGYEVVTYKTPSDSPSGRFAKTYGNDPQIDPLTRMLLFLANTSDDSRRMKKLLSENPDFLFIDRYYLCSLVYGCAFLKIKSIPIEEEDFKKLISFIEKIGEKIFINPNLYIIVDAPEEDRIRRLNEKESQGGLENEIERNALMQHYVRQFYKIFMKEKRDKVLWIVNLEGKLEEIAKDLSHKIISRAKV